MNTKLFLNKFYSSKRFLNVFLKPGYLASSCVVLKQSFSHKLNASSNATEDHGKSDKTHYKKYFSFIGILCGIGSAGLIAFKELKNKSLLADAKIVSEKNKVKGGAFRKDLPTFSEADVREHNTLEKGIWVSYKHGVYDITKFVETHPGGDKILLASGSPIEPFWNMYPVHYNSETFIMLEEYRIGNLKITDEKQIPKTNDPFQNDPKRHPLLKVITSKPFNAETPIQFSVENLITPNELHFKRNHLPVPKVNLEEYRLEIVNGLTGEKKAFTLDDIKNKFKVYTIPVTIQCSGNRRKEMHNFKPVQGLMWDINAISTAKWTGVKLKDLLEYCGFDLNHSNLKHIQFEGLDHDPAGSTYGASIPIEKVARNYGDVLIAFQMNDSELPEDHGFPLRVIVPGVVGARSVKWLSKIILSDKESDTHWQKKDYKLLPPNVSSLNEADFSKVRAMQESPITSAICEPQDKTTLKREDETFKIKGYAYSGGGRAIESVLVSFDDGETWKAAELKSFEQPLYRTWAWTIWQIEIDIPKDKDELNIICVATDSELNTQPETLKSIWNVRGLTNNSWHRINVKIK